MRFESKEVNIGSLPFVTDVEQNEKVVSFSFCLVLTRYLMKSRFSTRYRISGSVVDQ
jgi:hypothetical protein